MSQSASNPPRQRRGGRNRNRNSDRPAEHGSRDQHQRQRLHRDTETFQRPKGGPKLSFWQRILSAVGLGPKPPLRRADRPTLGEAAKTPAPRPPRRESPERSQSETREFREPRELRPPREPREPREPKTPRPVIQHEVTTGRLYVGNLSYDVTEADLTELFSGIGQVQSAEVVINRATQRSKGFAFVEMLTVDEAKRAVAELHDKEYMGRKMLVTGAKAADATRPADQESRSFEPRPSEPPAQESPSFEPHSHEPHSHEHRSYEPRSSESRPPRREPRPAPGPLAGDVTTGIIRREQLQGNTAPAAPIPAAPAPAPASTTPETTES